MSQRVRLDLGYDGTGFAGWAAQPGRRTVAGVLTTVLDQLFGTGGHAGLAVAGRTDAGVHATGQVCHLDVAPARWDALGGSLVPRLAGLLPPDVRVYEVTAAPGAFDARFSALSRRYAYRVADAEWGAPPLRHRDTLRWPRRLSLEALGRASEPLLGEHDFAAYCRRREHATTIRGVSRLSWRRDADGIVVAEIEADAFCQAMVRSLVGALLTVGDGRRDVSWPAALLERSRRADEVVVAPPHGLTLVAVRYPDGEDALRARAERTRNLRTPATWP